MRELTPVEQTEPCPPLTYEQQVAGLTDQQVLKEYEIRIQFLDRGCIVNVGCKAVAFSNVKLAIEAVTEYVDNPKKVSKKWRDEFNMG